ncbi:hypothetical protein C8J57DRAFT_1522911 [Mycena rebaudengoi]|nr:hypothetical protein C8J57DRAFT_1522911 [Mycena rebaudengoi]
MYEIQQELLEVCDIDACLSVIYRALRRRGFTRKRISRVAAQRDEDARANHQIYMTTTYRADQLVFVDEAACAAPFMYICGIKYSVLPALLLSGVLHLDVLAGSYKAEDFNSLVDGLLDNMNPFPGLNSVLIMDYASIHKSPQLHPMIEQR